MLEVSKKVLLKCCIIILLSWVFIQLKKGWNSYSLVNKFTQKQKRVKQSAKRTERAERADDVSIRIEGDVFEVGSMLNDKPLVLISKKETCKDDNYDIKLIEASGVFGTFNSYKKDLDNMDDILKYNFNNDLNKLEELFKKFMTSTTEVIINDKGDSEVFNSLKSIKFATGKDGNLLVIPTEYCKKQGGQKQEYVLANVFKMGGEFIFVKFINSKVKVTEEESENTNKYALYVSEKDGSVYMKYKGERYVLTSRMGDLDSDEKINLRFAKVAENISLSDVNDVVHVWNRGKEPLEKTIKKTQNKIKPVLRQIKAKIKGRIDELKSGDQK